MRLIKKVFLVLAVVLAVNVPVAASAGPIAENCEAWNAELRAKYNWQGDLCAIPDPLP